MGSSLYWQMPVRSNEGYDWIEENRCDYHSRKITDKDMKLNETIGRRTE